MLPGSNFINGQNNLSNQVNEEFNKLKEETRALKQVAEHEAPLTDELRARLEELNHETVQEEAGAGSDEADEVRCCEARGTRCIEARFNRSGAPTSARARAHVRGG